MKFTKRDLAEAAWIIARTVLGIAGTLAWYYFVIR